MSDINLKELQIVILEIMLEFDRICRTHKIKYQMGGGTLLGAVRHKGFIPWDDDLDIYLLREDYNKFLEISKYELDKRFFLQNRKTEKNCPYNFTRMRKNNTLALQGVGLNLDIHQGVFIDILPLDNISSNKTSNWIHRCTLKYIKELKRLKYKYIAYGPSGNLLKKGIKVALYWIAKPIPLDFFFLIENKAIQYFNNKNTKYITSISAEIDFYYKQKREKEDFYNVIEMEFEDKKFLGPKNYHEILTNTFGDYMTPPPIEEQKPIHGLVEFKAYTTYKRGLS